MTGILVDTGPLVALLKRRDSRHIDCTSAVKAITPPMLTCWPVLAEAAWLLRREAKLITRLLHWEERGIIRVTDLPPESLPWIAAFLERYSNLNADIADAALMYLAESMEIETIFTLDARDFSLYRLSRNRRMRLVPL
jgi:predicted nucleic acid-binding protein